MTVETNFRQESCWLASPLVTSGTTRAGCAGCFRTAGRVEVVLDRQDELQLLSITNDGKLVPVFKQPLFASVKRLCVLPFSQQQHHDKQGQASNTCCARRACRILRPFLGLGIPMCQVFSANAIPTMCTALLPCSGCSTNLSSVRVLCTSARGLDCLHACTGHMSPVDCMAALCCMLSGCHVYVCQPPAFSGFEPALKLLHTVTRATRQCTSELCTGLTAAFCNYHATQQWTWNVQLGSHLGPAINLSLIQSVT